MMSTVVPQIYPGAGIVCVGISVCCVIIPLVLVCSAVLLAAVQNSCKQHSSAVTDPAFSPPLLCCFTLFCFVCSLDVKCYSIFASGHILCYPAGRGH